MYLIGTDNETIRVRDTGLQHRDTLRLRILFFLTVNGRGESPLPDFIDEAMIEPKLTSYKFSIDKKGFSSGFVSGVLHRTQSLAPDLGDGTINCLQAELPQLNIFFTCSNHTRS